MQQALRSGELVRGDKYNGAIETVAKPEDDLGFAAALKLAIPAALTVWGLAIWGILHFIA